MHQSCPHNTYYPPRTLWKARLCHRGKPRPSTAPNSAIRTQPRHRPIRNRERPGRAAIGDTVLQPQRGATPIGSECGSPAHHLEQCAPALQGAPRSGRLKHSQRGPAGVGSWAVDTYQDGGCVQGRQLIQRPQHRHPSCRPNRGSGGARFAFKPPRGPPFVRHERQVTLTGRGLTGAGPS